jgi:perosamine synthetase
VIEMIPLDEPLLGDEELANLTHCIKSGWISWQGAYVTQLERDFAQYCGTKAAISMVNGSMALYVAIKACGIGQGDEVIVPTLTFSATVFAISMAGATPRFVDCSPKSMTVDPAAVASAIGPKTKAIIPVHLYGRAAPMDEITALAQKHGLRIIEDCAEAAGTKHQGRPVGGIGDLGCFSFHNKLIASGEGSVITTNDPSLAQAIHQLKTPAPENRTDFPEIAMNYRMSNLHAAVAVAQLARLEEIVAKKRRMAEMYDDAFDNMPEIEILPDAEFSRTVYWRYTIFTTPRCSLSRDDLVQGLRDKGYGARAIFSPMHEHPVYAAAHGGNRFPVAQDLSQRGLDLPSSPRLTEAEIRSIVACVKTLARS